MKNWEIFDKSVPIYDQKKGRLSGTLTIGKKLGLCVDKEYSRP